MTMLSFRVDDHDAALTTRYAEELGVDRSTLLRRALHRYLIALAGKEDLASWKRSPLSASEWALADVADWGPAEDWSEWDDAAR
jgi:hypothetical protein